MLTLAVRSEPQYELLSVVPGTAHFIAFHFFECEKLLELKYQLNTHLFMAHKKRFNI